MTASVEVIGRATLYHGRAEDILPTLGQGLTCVTDPPYLFSASGGGKMRAARKCLDAIQDESLDKGFDIDLLTAAQFPHLAMFCHNDQLWTVLPDLMAKYGRYVVCGWQKTNPIPVANKHYLPDVEPWVVAWADGTPPVWHLEQYMPSRFWVGQNGAQKVYAHPTVKPLELMRKIVRHAPGEVVVDPFRGTGTTGAAALIEGRAFIGIEKSRKFFEMAVHRMRRVYADGLVKVPS